MKSLSVEEVYDGIKQHIAVLCIEYEEEGRIRSDYYSGFFLDVNSHWLFITAGHCIEDLKSIKKSIVRSSFINTFSLKSVDKESPICFEFSDVKFEYIPEQSDYLNNERLEMVDFGYAILPDDLKKRLEINSVAITEAKWGSFPLPTKKGTPVYMLVGVPEELYDYKDDSDPYLFLSPACIEIKKMSDFCSKFVVDGIEKEIPHFQGKIVKGVIDSIQNMSGGPIFAIYHNGETWDWDLVAIQNSILRRQRETIIADYAQIWIRPFKNLLVGK
jgi:hypothetical protein